MNQIAEQNLSELANNARAQARSRFLWAVVILLCLAGIGLLLALVYAFCSAYFKTGG
jgi:hypothetical protein